MRRLLPLPATEITIADACRADRRRRAGRPWVELCMVSSIDGSAVVDEASAGLSGDADRAMFLTLRAMADVILVGAGTVRAEGYGPPRTPGQRIGVVTRRAELDLTTPLFTSGAGFLVLPATAPAVPVDSVRAGDGEVDLAGVLAQLDVNVVQAEGGPQLNGALAAADLVDEVNLTLSPRLAGGDGPRIVQAAPAVVRTFELAQIVEEGDFAFIRWVRSGSSAGRTSPAG